MWENKQLDEIQQHIFLGRLGKALNMTQNYVLTFPQRYDTSILQELKNNYQLMTDYWRGGAVDPRRNEVYHKLLRQLNALVTNMMIQDRISHTSSLQSLYKRGEEILPVISEHLLQVRLEEYVANVAMLEFEQEQQREEKRLRLHQEHQQFMDRLFGYILTSGVWPDWQADAFADILLSPTVDSHDQQLIVSAVMLSAMSVFDFHKFRVLVKVYRDTTDPSLRQRALVGWVFSADNSMAEFYPEMRDMIVRLCDDEQVCKELIELQMQVVFCQNAEDDRQTIQNEIMPDLMKASNLHITRQGIEEKDDDPMRDILHPDAAEEDMERMEQSMNRMMDMQKQGADIYFAGFSQMKRFTFFYDISNWFAPFSPDHPGISHIWQQGKGRKFLHVIMQLGAFCDSDKYSFVLAFEQVAAATCICASAVSAESLSLLPIVHTAWRFCQSFRCCAQRVHGQPSFPRFPFRAADVRGGLVPHQAQPSRRCPSCSGRDGGSARPALLHSDGQSSDAHRRPRVVCGCDGVLRAGAADL